jgi:hypothetical protein
MARFHLRLRKAEWLATPLGAGLWCWAMRSACRLLTLLFLFDFGCSDKPLVAGSSGRVGNTSAGGSIATGGVGFVGSGFAGTQASSGGPSGAGGVIARAPGSGSLPDGSVIANTAGATGTGGSGSTDMARDSGASGSSGKCESIERLPMATVPVCTLTGGGSYLDNYQGDLYLTEYDGCPDSSVEVTMDSGYYYFVVNHDQSVIRCPIGVPNARVFEDVHARTYDWIVDTLDGQTRSNGLIRFVCKTDQYMPSDYSYRTTCSSSGIRTGQPDLKSGSLYVLFPKQGSDVGTIAYEGVIAGYSCFGGSSPADCPRSVSFYTVKDGKRTELGTQPLGFSSDHKTLSFNDMSGRSVTIILDDFFEVTDVRW